MLGEKEAPFNGVSDFLKFGNMGYPGWVPACLASLLFPRAHIRNVFAKGCGEVYLMVLLIN